MGGGGVGGEVGFVVRVVFFLEGGREVRVGESLFFRCFLRVFLERASRVVLLRWVA